MVYVDLLAIFEELDDLRCVKVSRRIHVYVRYFSFHFFFVELEEVSPQRMRIFIEVSELLNTREVSELFSGSIFITVSIGIFSVSCDKISSNRSLESCITEIGERHTASKTLLEDYYLGTYWNTSNPVEHCR
jgi:hypothetical protein